MKKVFKLLVFIFIMAIAIFNFTPEMAAMRRLPEAVFIERSDDGQCADDFVDGIRLLSGAGAGAVSASYTGDETLGARRIRFKLFGVFELGSIQVYESERAELLPCGNAVGISIRTNGVLVVGFGDIAVSSGKAICPAEKAGLKAGDVILSVNGCEVFTSEEFQLALNASLDEAELIVERGGRRSTITVTPIQGQDGKLKIGAWVRDSTVGIGTLSFVVPFSGRMAALGHAVLDADTSKLLPVMNGELVRASILGVTKGKAGFPGELRGTFSSKSERIGSVDTNAKLGIFGDYCGTTAILENGLGIGGVFPLAFPTEVHTGEAFILAQTGQDGVQKYDCRIVRTTKQAAPDEKGIVVEITDPRLIDLTGGIVQGMSGSPIIQDGKLAGIVTHVFVNDPVKGYGVYAYWMYESCGGG